VKAEREIIESSRAHTLVSCRLGILGGRVEDEEQVHDLSQRGHFRVVSSISGSVAFQAVSSVSGQVSSNSGQCQGNCQDHLGTVKINATSESKCSSNSIEKPARGLRSVQGKCQAIQRRVRAIVRTSTVKINTALVK
jgi:hypothetical protein